MNLLLYSKFKDSFKFLYKIEISIPKENSNPAKPNIKKDKLNKVISQYIEPKKIDNVYKISHTSSDIKRIYIKFLGFINKTINTRI